MGYSRSQLFMPGWGAPSSLYRPGLPLGWQALDLPSFRRSDGSFDFYRAWALEQLERFEAPLRLGGHSMGGALAIAAAAEMPERVDSLVLISPAGLPLSKPFSSDVLDFFRDAVNGFFPARQLLESLSNVLLAPFSALAVARSVYGLDLSGEMRVVREQGVPATVIGCTSDTVVPVEHCRRIADLLDASYRELQLEHGHAWMLADRKTFTRELALAGGETGPRRFAALRRLASI